MGKTDARLHARTQADADTMAAKWAATFGERLAEIARDSAASGRALPTTGLYEADVAQLTDAERVDVPPIDWGNLRWHNPPEPEET